MPHVLKDTWIRVVNPFILVALSVVSQQTLLPPLTADKIESTARLILIIIINFEAGRLAILWVRRRFPELQDTNKRVLYGYLASIVITFATITLSTIIGRMYVAKPVSFAFESLLNLLQSFWIAALVMAPYEVLYAYFLSMRSEKEKEALLRENIQTRLHSLQAQIHPHFLFNTLNTLSALTIKDPCKAEEFVVEMSSVYRYLLQQSNENLTTLREELAFIRSFMHLLKTRFEEALVFDIDIADEHLDKKIPPLSLQLLIENAVKHNELADEQPLHIRLFVDEKGRLVVGNTLRKKAAAGPSNGFGLSSIVSKYRLLQPAGEVLIAESAGEFRVSLPLINIA